jgi:hypothetical protein
MLASVPENESGEYQVDGVGVWQILPNRVVERMTVKRDDMPADMDWQIDRWSGNRCVELSAIPRATFEDFVRAHNGDDSPEALAKVRRDHFRLSPVAGTWRIVPSTSPAPCFRIDGAG